MLGRQACASPEAHRLYRLFFLFVLVPYKRLLPDDLVVMVECQLTPSLSAVEYRIHQIPAEQPVALTIERETTLREVVFKR